MGTRRRGPLHGLRSPGSTSALVDIYSSLPRLLGGASVDTDTPSPRGHNSLSSLRLHVDSPEAAPVRSQRDPSPYLAWLKPGVDPEPLDPATPSRSPSRRDGGDVSVSGHQRQEDVDMLAYLQTKFSAARESVDEDDFAGLDAPAPPPVLMAADMHDEHIHDIAEQTEESTNRAPRESARLRTDAVFSSDITTEEDSDSPRLALRGAAAPPTNSSTRMRRRNRYGDTRYTRKARLRSDFPRSVSMPQTLDAKHGVSVEISAGTVTLGSVAQAYSESRSLSPSHRPGRFAHSQRGSDDLVLDDIATGHTLRPSKSMRLDVKSSFPGHEGDIFVEAMPGSSTSLRALSMGLPARELAEMTAKTKPSACCVLL